MTTLLVCSVGGHLAELWSLLPRFQGLDEAERLWVTFDTPQSRSLLADEEVVFVDYTSPRDFKNVARHGLLAARMLRGRHPYSTVISTGSGIALSFLPLARARGAACHFIESATRSEGPSLSGRLLRRVPGIALYAQYPSWAHHPWRYRGSVLDGYVAAPAAARPGRLRRVVVTLGTMPYSFRRAVERLIAILPPEAEVIWQVGWTDVQGLSIEADQWLPADELEQAIADADVVVAHAGMGSSLAVLEAGKCPLLLPRLKAHGENIDDHHLFIAEELTRHDLAVVRSVEELTVDDLYLAASKRIERRSEPPPFALAPLG